MRPPVYKLVLMALFALFSMSAVAQQHATGSEKAQPAATQPSTAAPTQPRSAQPEPGSEAPEHAAGPTETHATSVSGKSEAGEKAGSEDVEEKMKLSPNVQRLGRKLGLNVHQAYWLSVGFNFAVLVFLIGTLMRAKLPNIFRGRTGSIQQQMEEARKASAEASTRLADIEARLSRLDSQISEMRTSAEQEAAAEEERLRAAAEAERRRIVESAEQEISAISGNARRDLKEFAAELAVGVATKRIRVDEATDRNLVHDFASHLNDGSKGGA